MTSRVDFGWKPTTTAIFRWNPSCGGERDPPDSIIFLKIEALSALTQSLSILTRSLTIRRDANLQAHLH